jgi:hypothetical protein
MLTFFRRIRKGLLDGGRASKYLIYAIGEILLVMVGILLALQVNNWNSKRLGANEEIRILTSLHEELIVNRTIIADKELWYKDQKSAISSIFSEASSQQAHLSNLDIDTLLGKISWWNPTNIEMSAADMIILGGKLPLISNEDLRLAIPDWNRMVDWVQQHEGQDYDTHKSTWMPYLQVHGYLPQISNSITEPPGGAEKQFVNSAIPLGSNAFDHSILVGNREFQNVLLMKAVRS